MEAPDASEALAAAAAPVIDANNNMSIQDKQIAEI
jgi:hypothetical protein